MFPILPCLTFFIRLTLEFTWCLTFSSKPFIMVIKKHVCVFCFLSCLLLLHWFFVWNYSYYTSTELLARYKSMWISFFTSICLPNIFYLFIILFSPPPPPPPPYLYVQSRQLYNHAFYQLIIFSLTNNAPVKHLIIYVGGIYRHPPQPDFCLLPPVCLEIPCIFLQLYACV